MSRRRLLDAARRFCDDFARGKDSETVVAHFSDSSEVVEHGLSTLAPFLGIPFAGHDGVRRYLSTIAALIAYKDMHFSDYIADIHARKVSVKGSATFVWITTGDSWAETFAYVLDFDHEYKITRQQIWGDTGALYLASQSRLDLNVIRPQ